MVNHDESKHKVLVTFGNNQSRYWDMDMLRTQLNAFTRLISQIPTQSDEEVQQLWALAEALDDEAHEYFMREE